MVGASTGYGLWRLRGLVQCFLILTLLSENEGTNVILSNPKWRRGEGCSGQPKYAFHDVSHIFFKSIIRGAVLFWMSDYRYLIITKT